MANSADLDDTTTDVGTDHDKIYAQSTKILSNDNNNTNKVTEIPNASADEPETMDSQFFHLLSKFDSIISDYITDDKIIVPIINGLLNLNATIQRADLWSNNESFDDVQTDYIKFSLVSSMLSKLHSNLNPPHRVKWLQTSNYYANLFLNTCDKWNILNKMDQNTFYKLKSISNNDDGDNNDNIDNESKDDNTSSNPSNKKNTMFKTDNNGKVIFHPKTREMFEARDELIMRHKLDQEAQNRINDLLKNSKSKHSKPPSGDNKWKLFKDEENERQYWELKLQISIRLALRTIKQNTDELPLAMQMERQSRLRKHNVLSKYDTLANSNKDPTNIVNEFKQWEPRDNIDKKDEDSPEKGSGKLNIQVIDKSGKIEKFSSLNAFNEYGMNNRIDNKIEERVNSRNLVFKDPNPWTYTPEEAAALGLLPEIPKDLFEQQKLQKIARLEEKIAKKRYAPNWEVITNIDDGSQLEIGKVESRTIGGVTTINERDMPKNETQKHEDDMNEKEYNRHVMETRYWDAFKDDNTKGSGNPYYYG